MNGAVLLLLALASATPDTGQDQRLQRIGHRLAEANSTFCPKTVRIAGSGDDQPPVCASTFWVDFRKRKDAGADGEMVRVSAALIDYLAEDDELAAVVAHELAHNQLGHPQQMDSVKKGRSALVRGHEIEADRLAVWLLANAGFDPRAALRMWQNLGSRQSRTPKLAERLAIIETEIARLEAAPDVDGKRAPPLLARR